MLTAWQEAKSWQLQLWCDKKEFKINGVKIFSLADLIEVEHVAIEMGKHVLLEELLIAV